MKKITVILLVGVIIMLTSCQSIYLYTDTPETTVSPDVDIDEEYFTTGDVYEDDMWLMEDGRYYRGSWYYPETRKYRITEKNADGNVVSSSGKYITCIVKYNAATNTVSSACLNPSCNHSPDSDCLMTHICSSYSKVFIERIVGDWMLIKKSWGDAMTSFMYELIAYNLKTGESDVIYSESYEDMTKISWAGGTAYGNKLYMAMNILDYSETDFDMDGDVPLRKFEPKTRSFAYEYDFETHTKKELFELPSGYSIKAFSNKRLLVISDTEEFLTCNYDGSNMVKADVLDFSPQNMIGTYAYDYTDDGFKLYDLKTNTQKTVSIDVIDFYQDCIITNSGIMYNTFTTIDEWNDMIAGRKDYLKEHGTGSAYQYDKKCDEVQYKGTAQIWRSDHEGNDLELVFEKENAAVRYLFGNDRYIYCYVKYGDPNTYVELPYENEGRSAIDLETGKIISIPYLDIAFGENYQLIAEEPIEE